MAKPKVKGQCDQNEVIHNYVVFGVLVFVVLGFKLGASHFLGRSSTT
jgi:hypothetical protein